MRHLKRGRKLNRNSSHRHAMIRNLVTSLFLHGKVVTTPAKAKEARPFAEKMITLAKKGALHNRRRAVQLLHNPSVVKSLFEELGPRYKDRPGGYCRILHLSKTRVGDSASQVLFELVEAELPQRGKNQARAAVKENVSAQEASNTPAEEKSKETPAAESPAESAAAEESSEAEGGDAVEESTEESKD